MRIRKTAESTLALLKRRMEYLREAGELLLDM
jgi:chorismate mutase